MRKNVFLKRVKNFRFSNLFCATFAVVFLSSLGCGIAVAQPSASTGGVQYLHRSSLPTGEIAAFHRVGDPNAGKMQPIAWKLPKGVAVGVAAEGEYLRGDAFGLAVGSVYRFQITDIPYNSGRALYPTLEIIGKMNPPAGREWDFPIEIVVPLEDLELALKGNLVTRVVFVENSENAANVDSSEPGKELTVDVSPAVDAVAVAETRGRAVAILRMGSRNPLEAPNALNPFFFGLPPFELKPVAVSDVAPTTQTLSETAGTLESVAAPETFEVVAPQDGE